MHPIHFDPSRSIHAQYNYSNDELPLAGTRYANSSAAGSSTVWDSDSQFPDETPPPLPSKDSNSSVNASFDTRPVAALDTLAGTKYCLDDLYPNGNISLPESERASNYYENAFCHPSYSDTRARQMGLTLAPPPHTTSPSSTMYTNSTPGKYLPSSSSKAVTVIETRELSMDSDSNSNSLPPLPPHPHTNENFETMQQQLEEKKKKKKMKQMLARPWIVWTLTAIQVVVFLAEFIRMGVLTGSPVQTKPSFNPMIGPSSYVLINMGARFTPCMHAIKNITDVDNLMFPCPNSTTTATNVCSLSQLCGMGGLPDPISASVPNQWWRFITPIFLHGGIIHIGFNMLLQIVMGGAMERNIGHVRFFIVYFASGIAGFVLGGNFTPNGIASTGASGSLFGIIALDFLDLLFNWQQYKSPKRALLFQVLEIVVSFGIGLLPGLDNFSHIGGFAMGLLLGTAILRSPMVIQRRLNNSVASSKFIYEGDSLKDSSVRVVPDLKWIKNPKQQLIGRPLIWYAWVFVRLAAVALAIVYLVVLINQFENGGGNCSWCKYLSCLPVKDWCDIGNIETTQTQASHVLLAFALARHWKSGKNRRS